MLERKFLSLPAHNHHYLFCIELIFLVNIISFHYTITLQRQMNGRVSGGNYHNVSNVDNTCIWENRERERERAKVREHEELFKRWENLRPANQVLLLSVG